MNNNINSLSAFGKVDNSFLKNIKEEMKTQSDEEVFDFSNVEQNTDVDSPLEKPVENKKKSLTGSLKKFFSAVANVVKTVLFGVSVTETKNDNVANDTASLYNKIATATNDSDRIHAEIQLNVLEAAQEKETLSNLYANLRTADSDEDREKALNDIERFHGLQQQKTFEYELNSLYSNLSEARTDEEKFQIQAEINSFLNENSLSLNEQLDNASPEERVAMEFDRDTTILQYEMEGVLSELYQDLANSTSDSERMQIQTHIEAVQSEYDYKISSFINEKLTNAGSDSERSVIEAKIQERQEILDRINFSNQIDELYNKRSQVDDPSQRAQIDAQINALCEQQDTKYLTSLYNDLQNATNDQQRESIIKEINDFSESRALNAKYDELSSKLSQTTDEKERAEIRAELKAINDAQNEKHLNSLYESLSNATSETDKYLIQQEIKQFQSSVAIENQLDNLVEQYDNCTDINERHQLELQINKLHKMRDENTMAALCENFANASTPLEKDYAQQELEKIAADIQYRNTLQELYGLMANATSNEQVAQIQAQIDVVMQEYRNL